MLKRLKTDGGSYCMQVETKQDKIPIHAEGSGVT